MRNEEKEKRRGWEERGEVEVEEVQIKAKSSPGDPSRVKST